MSQHSDRDTPYTEQDRKDLDQIKESVRGRLRQQRTVSEVIWDAAHGICEADRRGLWPMDMTEETGGGRRKPTRVQWASKVFGISERHARSLFNIGEGCQRDEVAGTGLTLKPMEQFSLSRWEIRDIIRALGIEGLSARALSAGRRAALPLLEDDDVAGARKEAERVARRVDRCEEREDQGKVSRPASPDPGPDDEPDAGRAFELASEALEEVEALKEVPPNQLDSGQLGLLVDVTERLACSARQARDRALGSGVEPTSPYREESRNSSSENSTPATLTYQYARPAPGQKLSFRLVLEAVRALDFGPHEGVVLGLCRAVAGKPLKEVEVMLLPAYQRLLQAGVARELADHWMALLTDEDWERRGRFALWFGRQMGTVALAFQLTNLAEQELPPVLRREVDALLAEFACHVRGVGGMRPADGPTERPAIQEA